MTGEATRVLLLPGIGNSGPAHWQSRWEATNQGFLRVHQRDWDQPDLDDWLAALDVSLGDDTAQTLIAAHSLGCLLLAHWAVHRRKALRGALLVAVPDPSGHHFPATAARFGPVPLQPLPFPSRVIASDDDPYGSPAYAHRCAVAWGSQLVRIGARGHINADSGLGDWPQGLELLRQL